LYDSGSRILCGLAFEVVEACVEQVKELSKTLDPKVARYPEFRLRLEHSSQSDGPTPDASVSPKAVPWAAKKFAGQDFLEILWTDVQPDRFGLAQLANVAWFYDLGGEALAIDIDDLGLILATFDLVLPTEFPFPRLDFEPVRGKGKSARHFLLYSLFRLRYRCQPTKLRAMRRALTSAAIGTVLSRSQRFSSLDRASRAAQAADS
jgi:hypothetical protein